MQNSVDPTTPPAILSSSLERRASLGPLWGTAHAPWLGDDPRPRPPHPSCVWDVDREQWGGVSDGELLELEQLAELEQCGPVPGVAPGANRRHGKGPAIPWRVLQNRLSGIAKRRGRTGDHWVWTADKKALTTMLAIHEQTARASTLRHADIRVPTWLRAEHWGLTPNELLLLAALLSLFEAGWGGLYDSTAAIAGDLIGCSVRTVQNMMNGQRWKRRDGTVVHRPGLVARGLVDVQQTYKPGAPRAEDGAPSQHHWLLMRIGPAVAGPAMVGAIAKRWTGRARKGSGWNRTRARRRVRALRTHTRITQARATTRAWTARAAGRGSSSSSTPAAHNLASSSKAITPIGEQPSVQPAVAGPVDVAELGRGQQVLEQPGRRRIAVAVKQNQIGDAGGTGSRVPQHAQLLERVDHAGPVATAPCEQQGAQAAVQRVPGEIVGVHRPDPTTVLAAWLGAAAVLAGLGLWGMLEQLTGWLVSALRGSIQGAAVLELPGIAAELERLAGRKQREQLERADARRAALAELEQIAGRARRDDAADLVAVLERAAEQRGPIDDRQRAALAALGEFASAGRLTFGSNWAAGSAPHPTPREGPKEPSLSSGCRGSGGVNPPPAGLPPTAISEGPAGPCFPSDARPDRQHDARAAGPPEAPQSERSTSAARGSGKRSPTPAGDGLWGGSRRLLRPADASVVAVAAEQHGDAYAARLADLLASRDD